MLLTQLTASLAQQKLRSESSDDAEWTSAGNSPVYLHINAGFEQLPPEVSSVISTHFCSTEVYHILVQHRALLQYANLQICSSPAIHVGFTAHQRVSCDDLQRPLLPSTIAIAFRDNVQNSGLMLTYHFVMTCRAPCYRPQTLECRELRTLHLSCPQEGTAFSQIRHDIESQS